MPNRVTRKVLSSAAKHSTGPAAHRRLAHPRLSSDAVHRFQRLVWRYFRQHRRDLPWRTDTSPYTILVSELMLQQTQVDRVVPKFIAFLQQFPDFTALATAPLGAVLKAWQGLGYNRRARALHQAAQMVVRDYNGQLPRTTDKLQTLPGIGPYTAGAIAAFAYNKPVTMIETNIRAVFIHHFFHDQHQVHDQQLLPLITATVPAKRPRKWYWALMDYGSHLKKQHSNPSRRSAHHTKQSSFLGSNRQIRGAIIKLLATSPALTRTQLTRALPHEPERVATNLKKLAAEGMVHQRGRHYSLP